MKKNRTFMTLEKHRKQTLLRKHLTNLKIDSELQKMKTKKDRLLALKKQINIHKEVFQIRKRHKNLFNFSKKGKVFDEGTLRNNLLKNLRKENSDTPVCETSFFPKDLLSTEIIHTRSKDGKDVQWEGKILSHANGVFKVI